MDLPKFFSECLELNLIQNLRLRKIKANDKNSQRVSQHMHFDLPFVSAMCPIHTAHSDGQSLEASEDRMGTGFGCRLRCHMSLGNAAVVFHAASALRPICRLHHLFLSPIIACQSVCDKLYTEEWNCDDHECRPSHTSSKIVSGHQHLCGWLPPPQEYGTLQGNFPQSCIGTCTLSNGTDTIPLTFVWIPYLRIL